MRSGTLLLTVTTTHTPATDLGYLLHKNPSRYQTFEMTFGTAHVFYPEVSDDRCTAALLLEVDPVGLVRRRRGPAGDGGALKQYVNDRPYASSSFMSVAIGSVFRTALRGVSDDRQEVADAPMPLELTLTAVPCRNSSLIAELFAPLGYTLRVDTMPLDDRFPAWGASRYHNVRLSGQLRLADALSQLYVLLPVLDDGKHYWVGEDEVEKLLAKAGDWLATHPRKELIVERYLRHQERLVASALEQLLDSSTDEAAAAEDEQEPPVERMPGLNEQRLGAVLAVLKASGARRVADLGCGDGKLVAALAKDATFERITAMDVSSRQLEILGERMRKMPPRVRERITALQGSLVYRDQRLAGHDAAAIVEVIEHLDPPRLSAFEDAVFAAARPATVVLTTPNVEYNVRYEGMAEGAVRHADHRFEWTRLQFQDWCAGVSSRNGYDARFLPVGADDPDVGPPTQMAVFTRCS